MDWEDKRRRDLARLEAAQQRTQARLEQQRVRLERQFERVRERIEKKYGDPSVSQQRIIDAALELLDEDGLNSLSLRKLAARLDMQAPALYWHFKNKEVLIDYMAEAILQSEFRELTPMRPDEAWQDWLVNVCQRLRSAMRSRRDGARVVAGAHLYPAVTLIKLFEVGMQSLTSAGIELQRANLIVETATHYVFGNVIEEQAAPSLEEIDEALSGGLLDDYPLVLESVQRSLEAVHDGHDEFEDSLRLIIGYPE